MKEPGGGRTCKGGMALQATSSSDQAGRDRFEALWHAHYADVLAFTLRRIGDEATAGDLTAETFTVAWRRFDSAPDPSLAWLLAIAHKLLANHRRGEARRDALVARVRSERVIEQPRHEEEPDALLARAFNALSYRDREALSLVTWQELTTSEAAEVLGISPARFSVRLHRAKGRLRRSLEREGHPAMSSGSGSQVPAEEQTRIRLEPDSK